MKIEVGKSYRTRDGVKVDILGTAFDGDKYGDFNGLTHYWDKSGAAVMEFDRIAPDIIAEWTNPVTLSTTWEVMDPAAAAHDLDRISLPDGRVYARRVVAVGEVALEFDSNGDSYIEHMGQDALVNVRITLPTRDGALIAGTYTSADGNSVVVGVV